MTTSLPNYLKQQVYPYRLEKVRSKSVVASKGIVAVNPPDICDWAEERFYVVETKRPIVLEPVQKEVLRLFFERNPDGTFKYQTGLYSTIKKSGKTTIAAMVQQWATETWGDYGEVYHIGNKLDQAKRRAYTIQRNSIEMSPYRKDWDIQELCMTHITSKSSVRPLPLSASGEAGGNQRLTSWTEVWGIRYEAGRRAWDELQPVPTQRLSFRFAESYAGFEGESLLLRDLWDMGLSGERLHEEYPIYGVPAAGLIAYIDTGVAARRMRWQTDEYYAKAEASERPSAFKRVHLNEWVSSVSAFIDEETWNALRGYADPADIKWVFIGVDASVSHDSTAITAVTLIGETIYELETRVFTPTDGKLDYDLTIAPTLKAMFERWRVRQVVYDEYQLHSFMTRFSKEHRHIKFVPFKQDGPRVESDTALYNRIQEATIRHSGSPHLAQHMRNANKHEVGSDEEKGIRIEKRHQEMRIDAVVALSMASIQASKHQPAKLYGGGA